MDIMTSIEVLKMDGCTEKAGYRLGNSRTW
nr:MAG TPA: hypothetical protein [Bacteriophage sp.]